MGLEIIILSEVSQAEKNAIWYRWYVKSKKIEKWYKWSYLQNRNRLPDIRNRLMVIKGESGGW